VKTTEAHHFRRVALQRQKAERADGQQTGGEGAAAIRRGFGIRDGAGIMFVSHTGDVYPSGFLPIPVGNVRGENPVSLYRESRLFQQLRDPDGLKGKCGVCEYRAVCGGARSRAWAATGDPLGEDPLCVYRPRVAQGWGEIQREMGNLPQVARAVAV
jgi:radical SAM protein with 4Fe4S-binding SPASM domain